MGDHAEFKDHIEMQEYAERSGLDYTWAGTKLFAKREHTLPPDQLEVRPVQTKRGITMVGLFSAAITRVEREADAPYREAIAAKRLKPPGGVPSGPMQSTILRWPSHRPKPWFGMLSSRRRESPRPNQREIGHDGYDHIRPVRGCARIAWINRGSNHPRNRHRAKSSVTCRLMGLPHRFSMPH